MRLRALGGLALDGSTFSRTKPLLLLAYLALEGPTSRRELADLFFMRSKDPRDSLSTALRYIRRASPHLFELKGDRLIPRLACDAVELLGHLDAGRFDEAVRLYAGAFAKGIDLSLDAELEEWLYTTREYLAGRMREAHLMVGEGLADRGQFNAAAGHAETAHALVGAPEIDPEDFGRMHALLSLAKSPMAERVKQEAAALGIEIAATPLEARQPLLARAEAAFPRHNLPILADSFVGRDPELMAMSELLAEPHCRLLTLHGAGGVGKTRLAVQVAHEQLGEGRFQDGVYFVALDALTSPDQIPLSIAEVLGTPLRGRAAPLEEVTAHLVGRRMLLILDNYDQVISGASVAADLVTSCPELKVIVTSRERLALREEHVLTLEGLPLPDQGGRIEELQYVEALQLLAQRAKKARLDFQLTVDNAPAALKICRLLGGYPLGIELAAAWVRVLPLADIAREIEHNLDFLQASSRNVAERHQSIRAAFGHSWQLLTPREQEVLRRLSVFRGGFRREAAREVAGASLTVLTSLVDKSLLRASRGGRYDRHELLYQYTRERLLAEPRAHREAQDKHAAHFLALAEEAEPYLMGSEQHVWLARLETELDNFRASLEWAASSGQTELGLRLVGALWRFWLSRGFTHEGRQQLRTMLSLPHATTASAARAKALNGAGVLAMYQGDYCAARSFCEEGLHIRRQLGDTSGAAHSLHNLGYIAYQQGEWDAARELYEQSLALKHGLGDDHGIAGTLDNLGLVASQQGDYETARALHEESLRLRQRLGDTRGMAGALHNLGLVAHHRGAFAAAREYYEQSLSLKHDLNDMHGMAVTLNNLGAIARYEGDPSAARTLFDRSLTMRRELGDRRGVAFSLNDLGVLAREQGDVAVARALLEQSLRLRAELGERSGIALSLEATAGLQTTVGQPLRAAMLWGAAQALREALGAPLPPCERSRYERAVAAARADVEADAFADSWDRGRSLTLDEAVACALGSLHIEAAEDERQARGPR